MSHRRHRIPDKPLDIVLPITPMLDMSFQLLAFFVMTFKAANASEGQLDMFLPKAGEPRAAKPEEIDPNKNSEDIDTTTDVTVAVAADRAGEVGDIKIVEKATTAAVVGETTGDKLKTLAATLKRMHDAVGGNKDNIKIEADGRLKYARLIDVMDACVQAGYRQVGFAPPPDLGKK